VRNKSTEENNENIYVIKEEKMKEEGERERKKRISSK